MIDLRDGVSLCEIIFIIITASVFVGMLYWLVRGVRKRQSVSPPELIEATRGSIVLEIDGSIIDFQGEAYLRGYGSPDYVIYSELVTDTGTGSRITGDLLIRNLEKLKYVAKEMGWTIEIE